MYLWRACQTGIYLVISCVSVCVRDSDELSDGGHD
jgi:hypothetical protein